jgi:hypothetical protein
MPRTGGNCRHTGGSRYPLIPSPATRGRVRVGGNAYAYSAFAPESRTSLPHFADSVFRNTPDQRLPCPGLHERSGSAEEKHHSGICYHTTHDSPRDGSSERTVARADPYCRSTGRNLRRMRCSSKTTTAPRSSAPSTEARLETSRASCFPGTLVEPRLKRITDGFVSPLRASREPKSVSAETIVLSSRAAREKIASSSAACI